MPSLLQWACLRLGTRRTRVLVGATVYFWAASEPTKNHGHPAPTTDEAMQNGATSCLEYLAKTMDIDIACPQVHKMKDEIKRLSGVINDQDNTIKALKSKLEKKTIQVRGLSKGWGSCAEDIFASGNRIGAVAEGYLPTGASPLVTDVSWDFYGHSQEADNLKQISLLATDAIQSIGIYPYDAESDCSECDEFPAFCPSEGDDGSFTPSYYDVNFYFDENA